MEGGPPNVRRVSRAPPFSGPRSRFPLRGCHPLWPAFPDGSGPQRSKGHWPGPRSLATTSGVSVDVLSSGYWNVSVRRVRLPHPMDSGCGYPLFCRLLVGCPIRRSRDQRSLASPPGFSQRATSFIAYLSGARHPPDALRLRFFCGQHPNGQVPRELGSQGEPYWQAGAPRGKRGSMRCGKWTLLFRRHFVREPDAT